MGVRVRFRYLPLWMVVTVGLLGACEREARPQPAPVAAPPASAPATQPVIPESSRLFEDVFLYDPNATDGLPEWSLPAALQGEEMQKLIASVDRLQGTADRVFPRLSAYNDNVAKVASPDIREALWKRLVGTGFKDPDLPKLWYQVAKDQVGLLNLFEKMGQEIMNATIGITIGVRLAAVKTRILGGQYVWGDVYFVRSLQGWVDSKTAFLDRQEPLLEEVVRRLRVELNIQPRAVAPPEPVSPAPAFDARLAELKRYKKKYPDAFTAGLTLEQEFQVMDLMKINETKRP